MMRETQATKILGYLRKAGSITPWEAMIHLGLETNALTARISELERDGVNILRERRTHPVSNKTYTEYYLA